MGFNGYVESLGLAGTHHFAYKLRHLRMFLPKDEATRSITVIFAAAGARKESPV